MITNEFHFLDPLKDDVNTVPALPGNYIFALRKNSKLPDVGIPVPILSLEIMKLFMSV